jgi:N-methylhydantoinase A
MRRIAIDIGGTFTDAVLLDTASGEIITSKVSSTPKDYSIGLMESINKLGVSLEKVDFFAHGTTVCINAIIQGLLPPTALITTKGFRDIAEIGRGNRIEIYDPFYKQPPPLVPRRWRHEVDERTLSDGSILKPLNESEASQVASQIVSEGVRSIAVCLLHSYKNSRHELSLKKIIKANTGNKIFLTVSSDICREYYDYERTCTTILNAALMPIIKEYLTKVERNLGESGFTHDLYIMQSNGGMMTSSAAKETPVYTINSGLVGGIIAVRSLCKPLGLGNLIGADMGGTSFDVELVVGSEYQMRQIMSIKTPSSGHDGYPILFPTVDIHAIGAGGGSIAWLDEASAMHVGPKSASAEPGPACYGRGGSSPTVTDANVFLGRLSPRNFLGGEMKVYPELADKAISELADMASMSREEVASGIIEIVVTNMAGAVETMTVKRGIDPREFAMISFGGAGPMHGPAIARELGVKEDIVPVLPGNFSAWGMLVADLKHDYVQTLVEELDELDPASVAQTFNEIKTKALKTLESEGLTPEKISFVCELDIRYLGQGRALSIPVSDDFTSAEKERAKSAYDEIYLRSFLHNSPSEPKEVVALRVSAYGTIGDAVLPSIKLGDERPQDSALKEMRDVYLDDGFQKCKVYERSRLLAGNKIEGPAIIEETTSATLIWPGQFVRVDKFGLLHIGAG